MTQFCAGQIVEIQLPNQSLTVEVLSPTQKKFQIPTFRKANGQTYFRFSGIERGEYHYQAGIVNKTFELSAFSAPNPLFTHGKIILEPLARHFKHADGTPFFWLADTWWYGNTNRAAWPEAFQTVTKKRAQQGFTASLVVVGEPPEVKSGSAQAANEGGLPFLANNHPNPAYLDATDQRLWALIEQGIVPCIVGSWAYHIEHYGVQTMKAWWHQLVARYAAWPVVFCLSGELGLVPSSGYFVDDQGQKTQLPLVVKDRLRRVKKIVLTAWQRRRLHQQLTGWSTIGQYVNQLDPFQTPMTAHSSSATPVSMLIPGANWLDLDTVQTGHSPNSLPNLVTTSQRVNQSLPWLNIEPWYEDILDQFGAHAQRQAFWLVWLSGAAGACYGAQGLWNMATETDQFMTHWGKTTWQSALKKPGATQLAHASKWLQKMTYYQAKPATKIISPSWEVSTPDLPLAAACSAHSYLVYFPQKEMADQCQLHLSAQHAWQISKLNPITMEPVSIDQPSCPDELWHIWYNVVS